MTAEIIILIVAFLFFLMSILLWNGKGTWLIAGYHTLSKEEQKKYDIKKAGRAMGCLCIICCVMLCIMAYMGYRVDSGMTDETSMLLFALIFTVIILTAVTIVIKSINKNN